MFQGLEKGIFIFCGLCVVGVLGAQDNQPVSLSLEDCLGAGLSQNVNLRLQRLDAEISREQVAAARGIYDTFLDASLLYQDSELPNSRTLFESESKTLIGVAGLSRRLGPGTQFGIQANAQNIQFPLAMNRPDEINISSLEFSLNQPLLQNAGGASDKALIEARRQGYFRSWLDYLYAREVLAARVVDFYWTDYTTRQVYRVEQGAVKRARELLEINRKKFKDGLLDETDILAAEASLATREVAIIEWRNAMLNARDRLLQLIRYPVAQWDRVQLPYDEAEAAPAALEDVGAEAAYRTALLFRPDLKALDAALEQANAEIVLREEALKSRLNLSAGFAVGNSDTDFGGSIGADRTGYSVGISLQRPWHRETEKAELEQAKKRLEQVLKRQQDLEETILLQCRKASRDLITAVEALKANKRAMDLQRKKLQQETKKLFQGRSSTRFVIEYQNDLEFSELSHVQAIADYQRTLSQYRLVQGKLVQTEVPSVPGDE